MTSTKSVRPRRASSWIAVQNGHRHDRDSKYTGDTSSKAAGAGCPLLTPSQHCSFTNSYCHYHNTVITQPPYQSSSIKPSLSECGTFSSLLSAFHRLASMSSLSSPTPAPSTCIIHCADSNQTPSMSSALVPLLESLSNGSVGKDGAFSLVHGMAAPNLIPEFTPRPLVDAAPPSFRLADLSLVALPTETEWSRVSQHAATYHSAHTGLSSWYSTSSAYGRQPFHYTAASRLSNAQFSVADAERRRLYYSTATSLNAGRQVVS